MKKSIYIYIYICAFRFRRKRRQWVHQWRTLLWRLRGNVGMWDLSCIRHFLLVERCDPSAPLSFTCLPERSSLPHAPLPPSWSIFTSMEEEKAREILEVSCVSPAPLVLFILVSLLIVVFPESIPPTIYIVLLLYLRFLSSSCFIYSPPMAIYRCYHRRMCSLQN